MLCGLWGIVWTMWDNVSRVIHGALYGMKRNANPYEAHRLACLSESRHRGVRSMWHTIPSPNCFGPPLPFVFAVFAPAISGWVKGKQNGWMGAGAGAPAFPPPPLLFFDFDFAFAFR